MADFKVESKFSPAGDQPTAISELSDGLKENASHQTLLGVTGSGKTYTIAKVIEEVQKPTLVISHNKTLAAQLYGEFKNLFPNNAVEYFISYYDYYQPESYMPVTDTFIEKDFSMNEEIDRLRLKATSSLLQRKDVIVVSSVSCIYGLGNPKEWKKQVVHLKLDDSISRSSLTEYLVDIYYQRNDQVLERCNFRILGDIFEIFPAYEDKAIRVDIFDNIIQSIVSFDPLTGEEHSEHDEFYLYPARHFISDKDKNDSVIKEIKRDLIERTKFFNENEKFLEEQRISQRTNFDIEMIQEIGYCSGIENYSRYFDGRKEGERPFTLIDFFPEDFLTVIDESHVTLPQIQAMYGGDRKRKDNLIDYGFRLPSAYDNRPLKSDEFSTLQNQVIYASATPSHRELELSQGAITELINRPTGLVDPELMIRPSAGQIDDLISEIKIRSSKDERCLVTTLTKKMAEDLSEYLSSVGLRVRYLHSEVKTIERVKILRDLRLGDFDVLVELMIRPSAGQIDDLISEIKIRSSKDERCLVTTLTKKMAEDLSEYLSSVGLRVRYLHSEVKTIERVKILRDLRLGDFDVLVGINLLREGLDLPEVSLVAILDADKEGFLRSKSSLVQTAGRAARHEQGKVILYADKITDSMKYLIDETERRRKIQMKFNKENNITPKTVKKSVEEIMQSTRVAESYRDSEIEVKRDVATDKFLLEDKKIVVEMIREEMLEAAENLEFEKAAKLRDEMNKLEKEIKL